MKKNIFLLAALFIASATFVACSSDDNIIDEPAQQGKYTISITAAKGDNGGLTRALSPNGSDIAVSWNEGEEVEVYQGTIYVGTLTSAASATSSTTLTGELNASFNPENMIGFYLHGANRVFTGQDGSLSHIGQYNDYGYANLFDPNQTGVGDAIKYTVTGSTVLGSISFSASNCILKFAFYQTDGTTPIYPKSLIIHDEANHIVTVNNSVTGNFQYDDMSIAVAANASSNTTNEVYVSMHDANTTNLTLFVEATDGKVYSYKVNGAKYFQASNYYRIKVRLTQVYPFTVNAGGTKVLFAPGNLQATWNGSSWSWAFAANQWDYIGNAAANTSISGNGTISGTGTVDLFGWVGASNTTWDGALGTTGNAAQYGISNSAAANSTSTYGNVATEALKSDWGNTISDGYTWRTLTGGSSGEWEWILGPSSSPNPGTNCRISSTVNGTANARFAKATVVGKSGIIIFPDTYTHPDGVTAPSSINTANADFTANSYDATAWGKMETAGCVFLPAAGYRNGTAVNNPGSRGYYWSSLPNTSNVSHAYSVYFGSGSDNLNPASGHSRHYGLSVRLVRVVE